MSSDVFRGYRNGTFSVKSVKANPASCEKVGLIMKGNP